MLLTQQLILSPELEISGFGRDLKVTVNFDEVGQKKLLLRYASLERDWP